MRQLTPRDRLIVALDPPYNGAGFTYDRKRRFEDVLFQDTAALIAELGSTVSFYKIGLRLFPILGRIIEHLQKKEKHIFLDLKSLDIPETVAQAAVVAAHLSVKFITVNHGSPESIRAAKKAINKLRKSRPKILFVWVIIVRLYTIFCYTLIQKSSKAILS